MPDAVKLWDIFPEVLLQKCFTRYLKLFDNGCFGWFFGALHVCCKKVYCLSKYDNSLFVIINKYCQALTEDKHGKKNKDWCLNKCKSHHHCKYKQITSRMSSKLAVSENAHKHTHPLCHHGNSKGREGPNPKTPPLGGVGCFSGSHQHNNSNGYLSFTSGWCINCFTGFFNVYFSYRHTTWLKNKQQWI